MSPSDTRQQLRDLEDAAPRAFTRRRDALARELKKSGEPAEAKRVRAMRRPTPSVWAVRSLARASPPLIEALLTAGAELVRAQRQALAGAGGDPLRTASRKLQRAVDDATARAEELLLISGESAPSKTLEKIHATLLAAATGDRAERAALREGRLAGDRVRDGFGPVEATAAAAPRSKRRSAQAAKAAVRENEARKRAEADLRAAQRSWEQEDARLQRAEKAAARARALEESARRKLEAARAALAAKMSARTPR